MSTLIDDVRAATRDVPGIGSLVVFGSRARGRERPNSDLDVAVLPLSDSDEKTEPLARRRLLSSLAVALADLAPEGRVDVVFLDEAPDVLRQKVLEHGILVTCHEPAAWRQLRVATMREYGDREWARKMFRKALRRRLTSGGVEWSKRKSSNSLLSLSSMPTT